MSAEKRRSGDGARSVPPPAALEQLLEDMRELRLTLAADLTAAAGAAEAGADDVVADILAGERRELSRFARRSRSRLSALAATGSECPPVTSASPRWRRRALVALPAVPLVGAVAVSAAAAAGLLPVPQHAQAPAPRAGAVVAATEPVATTFQHFETLVKGDPSASQVVAAATELHHQLEQLIARAPHDPAGATEIAKLLQMEQALLIRTQPPGTATVLAASRKLAAQLVTVVASARPAGGPSPTDMRTSPHSAQHTSPRPTSTATPTSASSSTPTSAPTQPPAQAPSPTASSSPSPSSSDDGNHLPTLGN